MRLLELTLIDDEKITLSELEEVLASHGLESKSIQTYEEGEAKPLDIAGTKSKKKGCCPGKGDKKSPNLAKKGFNFAKALTEHIITGKKHVPDSVYFQRLKKCEGCSHRLEGFVCAKCGCYMGIKASWAEQKCIENKW